MFAITNIFLLIIVSFCYGQTINRPCVPDTNDFATKVDKSSVVVYGKPMTKPSSEGNDSTFSVFFQVDCILKGPETARQINITNAGRAEGKQHCQEFSSERRYSIVFLEPLSPTDFSTYTPADFSEIPEDGNSTNELLARTCNLHRLVPRGSLAKVSEICPSVATHPSCLENAKTTTTNLLVNGTNVFNQTGFNSNDKGRLSQPVHTVQQELDAIKSKSGSVQVDVDAKSSAGSTTFNIILLIMAIFICSN